MTEWGTILHYRYDALGNVEVYDEIEDSDWFPFGLVEQQPQGYGHAGKYMLVVRTDRGDGYQGRFSKTRIGAIRGGLKDLYEQGLIL